MRHGTRQAGDGGDPACVFSRSLTSIGADQLFSRLAHPLGMDTWGHGEEWSRACLSSVRDAYWRCRIAGQRVLRDLDQRRNIQCISTNR
jgi:hypothetical protein